MTRKIILLGVAAGLVLTVAFFFLLYRPKAQQQAAVLEQTAALQAQQQQLRADIARLEDVRAREPQLRADLDRLLEFMPDGVEQASVLEAFQTSADVAAVEILSLTFGEPELVPDAPPLAAAGGQAGGQALARIPVSMVVDGGYFQTVDFFRRLELDIRRATLVDSVAITESEDGYPQLATTWSGHLFGVLPVSGTTTTPAPGAPATSDAATPPAPTSGSATGTEQA